MTENCRVFFSRVIFVAVFRWRGRYEVALSANTPFVAVFCCCKVASPCYSFFHLLLLCISPCCYICDVCVTLDKREKKKAKNNQIKCAAGQSCASYLEIMPSFPNTDYFLSRYDLFLILLCSCFLLLDVDKALHSIKLSSISLPHTFGVGMIWLSARRFSMNNLSTLRKLPFQLSLFLLFFLLFISSCFLCTLQ